MNKRNAKTFINIISLLSVPILFCACQKNVVDTDNTLTDDAESEFHGITYTYPSILMMNLY